MHTQTFPFSSEDGSSLDRHGVRVVPAEFELAERTQNRVLLLALAMLLIGLLGCGAALLLQESLITLDEFQVVVAFCIALAIAGLLMAVWAWWRWQRDVSAHRLLAVKLYRAHAVMSDANRLILRRPDPRELLAGVCEVCVTTGHMDLAVVEIPGITVADLSTAALAAEQHSTLSSSSPLGQVDERLRALMLNFAQQADEIIVVDNTSTDERLREVSEWCGARGLCSFAAIPLRRSGSLVGVLLLGSQATAAFAGEATALMSELGADLSFALDNSERERERHSAMLAEQSRRSAEEANLAKTEFLAQMSHEIRTPLNAILGFAQLLATDSDDILSRTQAERVRLMTQAGWHLLSLVDDVMDVARIESRRFEVVNVAGDIASVIDEAVSLTQRLAFANRVDLSVTGSKAEIGAMFDSRRLLQVLLNLLSNACKYNRPGGHVRVEVSQDGPEVLLDVIDDGVGMTQEQLQHLYEPFNRLGNEGSVIQGTGIGLTLTRLIVNLMNGRLDITSTPDSGTRARLVLPACAVPLPGIGEQVVTGPQNTADEGAVVLYVEDNPVNQILVEQMLMRCKGVQLLQALTGEDGVAMARARQPDLILLDMQLPDMSGFDVLAALGNDPRTKALRVVAVSADAIPADISKTLASGALAYWTKPLELNAFLTGVSAFLQVSAKEEAAVSTSGPT